MGRHGALSAAFTKTGAFGLTSTSADAALLSGLPAGGYSAQIVDAGGSTGLVLAEIYDTDPGSTSSRLINLSARAVAGSGANALAAGFVISGSGNEQLLIRGIGPTLGVFGMAGSLAAPVLTVYDAAGQVLGTNTRWGGSAALSAAFAQVGAFPLAANSADSALLLTLPAGQYTAQVTGTGNSSGVALLEVYEVSPPLPIQSQIANFLSANQGNPGPLVCTLAAGTYNTATAPINLTNVSFPKGLTIDGTGVHIVMTQFNSAINLIRCTGITITNLTVDYNPLPFTQGTVSQISTNNSGAITGVQLTLDSGPQWAAPPASTPAAPTGRIFAIDATGNLPFDTLTYYMTAVATQGPGQYALTFTNPQVDGLKVGHKLGIPLLIGAHAAYLRGCTNCGLDGVQIYASPNIGVFDQSSSGSFYNKVAIVPAPNSGNIRTANADGINVQDCVGGPKITNCTITHAGDDGIAIHGELGLVMQAVTGSNTLRMATRWPNDLTFFAGDTIGFYPSQGTGAYFTAAIGSIVRNTTVQPPAGFVYVYDVTLAAGQIVTANTTTWIQDETRAAIGFVVQGNTIANNRARGIFARGTNGSIVDNQISYTAMAGIGSQVFAGDFEGEFCKNLLIARNTLKEINYRPIAQDNLAGAISVTARLQVPNGTGSTPFAWGTVSGHTNTTITGNTVTNARGPYVHLHGGNQWKVSGNSFINAQTLKTPIQNIFNRLDENCVVWLDSVDGVTFGEQGANRVIQRGASSSGIVSQGVNVTNVVGLNTFVTQ